MKENNLSRNEIEALIGLTYQGILEEVFVIELINHSKDFKVFLYNLDTTDRNLDEIARRSRFKVIGQGDYRAYVFDKD